MMAFFMVELKNTCWRKSWGDEKELELIWSGLSLAIKVGMLVSSTFARGSGAEGLAGRVSLFSGMEWWNGIEWNSGMTTPTEYVL